MGSRRLLQHLYKHGNATGVTIPRAMLFATGWLPGEAIIIELLEGNQAVLVRRPTLADFPNIEAPRFVREAAEAVK